MTSVVPAARTSTTGAVTDGLVTVGGVTTGGVTTGGFTTGGVTTGGVTTGGFTTVAVESPITPTEVAPREIGRVIGAATWVPERSPSVPPVVMGPAGAVVVPVVPAPSTLAAESPTRPTDVAPRLI